MALDTSTPRQVTLRDAPALARVLSAAFERDPGSRYMLPDDATWALRSRWLYERLVRLSMHHGPGFMAGDDGVAVWHRPGAPPSYSLAQQIRVGLLIAPFKLGSGGLRRVLVVGDDAEARHRRWGQGRWYLDLLGVHPRAQGQGLGGALLKTQLAAIDAAGDGAYLFTQNELNLPMYQRFGFAVTEEKRSAADAPVMWTMVRAPQTAQKPRL